MRYSKNKKVTHFSIDIYFRMANLMHRFFCKKFKISVHEIGSYLKRSGAGFILWTMLSKGVGVGFKASILVIFIKN